MLKKKSSVLIVGAGIVGLCNAHELIQQNYNVTLVDKGHEVGLENSTNNSGVIHSGIYYDQSSLKSVACIEGKNLLIDFCKAHNINFNLCGKYIIATQSSQIERLEELYTNGLSLDLKDINLIDSHKIKQLLPDLKGLAAIELPSAGILDVSQLILFLKNSFTDLGGILMLNTKYVKTEADPYQYQSTLISSQKEITVKSDFIINAGGINSLAIANQICPNDDLSTLELKLGRGNYCHYLGHIPFDSLIYPLPEKHGLGIHITKNLSGPTKLGPDFKWVNSLNDKIPIGTSDLFYNSLKKIWPKIDSKKIVSNGIGFRPKLFKADALLNDFLIHTSSLNGGESYHLLGIESPGLTASFYIARDISSRIKERLS